MEMSEFAKRLADILEDRSMTRADLGRATGIPYHRLNPWFIRPTAKANGPDLFAVARALNVSEDYLLNGGEMRPFRATESLARRAGACQKALAAHMMGAEVTA